MQSKRTFNNFEEFPGALNKGTGFHEFPTLYHKDDAGHIRQWQIFIRCIKTPDVEQNSIDWNLLIENQVKLLPSYYTSNEPLSGIAAQVWVETGVVGGKIQRTSPTYFTSVAFVGQTNQRNQFQQALIYARSEFLKRKEKGGTESKRADKKTKGSPGTCMYFPMLAKPYKDGIKHIKWPAYIQPKLDGTRCVIFLKKKNGDISDVVVQSRTKKEYPTMEYLKVALFDVLNDLFDETLGQSIYLDGELYKHGKSLQAISGDSRNTIKNTKDQNEFHIYDCFYPLELSIPYEQRKAQLENMFNALPATSAVLIKPVVTYLVKDEAEAEIKFKEFTADKYEGAILRNCDGEYLANSTKTGAFMRSKDLVKMKKKFTDEFRVVGYTDGKKGKDKNAVIWQCETKKKVKFNVTPKDITYEERYRLYKECKVDFVKKYSNRMLTVEYEDLSNNGVPLRAKALTFRDYE